VTPRDPEPHARYARLADAATLEQVAEALRGNLIEAVVVDGPAAARREVLDRVPAGAAVLTATSRTLDACGITAELETSGRYRALRPIYLAMDRATQRDEIRRLRSAPDWVVGSVHAITHRGELVIASQTGSQLGSYVYGAGHVIWVVGAQKVVADLDEGLRRIEEYAFPLEDRRSREAYGTPSGINKLLVINREPQSRRSTVILLREEAGF